MMADTKNEQFLYLKNTHCLICNSRIAVSTRNCYEIFYGNIRTDASETPLFSIIGRILEQEIQEDIVHSNVLCKKCLKLINEVDEVETRLEELKMILNTNYQQTLKILGGISKTPPDKLSIVSKKESKIAPKSFNIVDNKKEMKRTPKSPDNVSGKEIKKAPKCSDSVGGKNGPKSSDNTDSKKALKSPNKTVKESIQEQHNENIAESEETEEYVEQEKEIKQEQVQQVQKENVAVEEMALDEDYDDRNSWMEIAAADSDDSDYVPIEEGEELEGTNIKVKRKHRVKGTVKESQVMDIPERIIERDGIYFVCLLCTSEKIMGDRKGIVAHLKDVHGIRVYICDNCLQCFTKRNDLSAHLDSHVASEEGVFQCEICSQIFHNIRLFETHKRIHFPQVKLWTCETCGKSYTSQNLLDEHINTHNGIRPYVCEVCDKGFASKYTYKTHMKTHGARARSFSCGLCGKSFFRAQSLADHERVHTGCRDFVCSTCGKAFITARYLEVHSVTHTGYKPFICRTCGKAFARRGEMANHERTHTGERPYQCEICGATFAQRSNLQSHTRATHLQEKRYVCLMCDKGFKRQRLLDYHIKAAHTGERPYKCPTCFATFIYPHHFKKHLRLHQKKV